MTDGSAFDRLDSAYRDALLRAVDLCIDEAFSDVATLLHGGKWDDLVFLSEALPDRPVYVQRYNALLAKEFLVCLITVAGKLTSGVEIELASVAEELALHALIRHASGANRDEEFDFNNFIDEVFEDLDFLNLFDEQLNGIQVMPAQEELGTANLHFENWFRPFRDGIGVHPYAALDQPSGDRRPASVERSPKLN